MENSYFAPGQFVIETKYPDWENIKHVMIRSFVETTDYDDRTQNTCDINNISLGFYDFTLKKLQENNIPIEEINAVSSKIEDGSFSIWDDLIHGYGGGYLAPVLWTKSRPASSYEGFKFKENMTVVIQPNVITNDHKAGIQTGELVHIQKDKSVRMHSFKMGYIEL